MPRFKKFQSPEVLKLIDYIKKHPPSPRARALRKVYENFVEILKDICVDLPADVIAKKYGVGERSLWRFFKNYNHTKETLRELCMTEERYRNMTETERTREQEIRAEAPPSDIDTLEIYIPWIKELQITESTRTKYENVILELCQFTEKPPHKITEEDIKEFINYKLIEWKEKKDLDITKQSIRARFSGEIITPLRVFSKFMGLRITPILRTTEYTSPYRSVRIKVDERYCILKYIADHYPEDYDYLKGILFLLYYNGHRASELTRIQYEIQEHYILVKTWGKKGLEYEKVLPIYVYDEVREVLENPPSKYQLDTIRRKFKEAYRKCLKKGTVTYNYALKIRSLHVWRHTACNDLIDYTDYNIGIIMRTLGWKNPKMIVQVYGEMTISQLARYFGWVRSPRTQFDYVYNKYVFDRAGNLIDIKNYLDDLFEEHLIGKKYYQAVKHNTKTLVTEFLISIGKEKEAEKIEG